MVADTFDAMTTNRPYQAAMDAEYVIRIINSLAATKFDPRVVKAFTAVFQKGGLRINRAGTVTEQQVVGATKEGSAPTGAPTQTPAPVAARTGTQPAQAPQTAPMTAPSKAPVNPVPTNPVPAAAPATPVPTPPASSPFITSEPVGKR